MATFTISTTQNVDELTSKGGGDTYNINGGTLTIDQDSRFGLNQSNASTTAATSLGNVTVSATLGGTLNIDGRYVRLVPFDGGSGTIPTLNSTVVKGSASGKLMCVYSSLTTTPLINGEAMPASGWIKIKQWNSTEYTTGALTISGVTANCTGSSVVGFLEIFGDQSATIAVGKLGVINVLGAWYNLGTTSGSPNQTFQIPNNGTLKHIAGVYIEKTEGQSDYEFYPNAGLSTSFSTDAYRGKVVWISNTGLVTIGNNGSTTMAYTPSGNLKVVIPNIFLHNCSTTARNAEIIPNATLGTRYEFNTSSAGNLNIDKANVSWYGNFTQAYSVQLTNTSFVDAINISLCGTPCIWTNVGVGQKPTTELFTVALTMAAMPNGGTFTDCVWCRADSSTSGAHVVRMDDCNGFTFTRNVFKSSKVKTNGTNSIYSNRMNNCVFNDCIFLQNKIYLATCSFNNFYNSIWLDTIYGTTDQNQSVNAFYLESSTNNILISGLSIPIANNNPYAGVFSINTGCYNIKLRNIGSATTPLDLGATYKSSYFVSSPGSSTLNNISIQRCYFTTCRNSGINFDNSCTDIKIENVGGAYDNSYGFGSLNTQIKGLRCAPSLSTVSAVYGLHLASVFTSDTVGRIITFFHEKTSKEPSYSSYSIIAGTPAFNANGGLLMKTVNDEIIYTTPHYILGQDSFQNNNPVMGNATIGNYYLYYKIDINDGNGYTANWATLSAANLSAISTINPSLGFKLQIRIVTKTANTDPITYLYLLTNTTTTSQTYTYPLDSAKVNLTGLISGTEIHVYEGTDPSTSVEIAAIESSSTSYEFTQYSSGLNGYITIIKLGYIFLKIPITYGSDDISIPITQYVDRNYLNPA